MKFTFCLWVSLLASSLAWSVEGNDAAHSDKIYQEQGAKTNPDACSEWVPTGKILHILNHADSSVRSARFSPDGTKIVTTTHRRALVADANTGKILHEIAHNSHVESAEFSPDGTKIVTASDDRTIKIVDVDTGQELQKIGFYQEVRSVVFSPDGTKIVAANPSSRAQVLDVATGKILREIRHYRPIQSAFFSPNGQRVVTASEDKTVEVTDVNSGESLLTIDHDFGVNSARFSPDGNKIVTAGFKEAKVVDIATKKVLQVIKHDFVVNSAQFSPDGTKILTASGDNTAKLVDANTGAVLQVFKYRRGVTSAVFSLDGSKILSASEDGTATVHSVVTGEKLLTVKHYQDVYDASFSADGKKIVTASRDGNSKLVSLDGVCRRANSQIHLSPSPDERKMHMVVGQLPCESLNLSQAEWDRFANPESGELSEETALAIMYRFQKPGAFEVKRHTNVLIDILSSKFPDRYPELVMATLENVLISSDLLYEYILEKIPGIKDLLSGHRLANPMAKACRSSSEEKALSVGGFDYISKKLVDMRGDFVSNRAFENFNIFLPLRRMMRNFDEAQQKEFLDKGGDYLVEGAGHADLRGLFASKIYYFAEGALESQFFGKEVEQSDFTVVRGQKNIDPYILSSHAMDAEDSKPRYGFYFKKLAPQNLSDLISGKVDSINVENEWKNNGHVYKTSFPITRGNINATLVSEATSPPYLSLNLGGLNGIIIAGTNMGTDTVGLIDSYRIYFEDEGFVFDGARQDVLNLPEFLRNKITSGELDYFVKEAHSDGDEKNVFRLNKKAYVMEGLKKGDDGKPDEKIFLVYPQSDNSSMLLGNAEFGAWVKEREKLSHDAPFVYFNTSCWSHAKALHEIEAAQTHLLINVASSTTVPVFRRTNVMGYMLGAFRHGKDYAGIRAEMNNDPGYKSGTGNLLHFPDEAKYRSLITDKLKFPVVYDIKITRDGKPYNIDQRGGQYRD